ncbi:MAG: hypothetical protein U0236_03745 [Nitrospira sp.]
MNRSTRILALVAASLGLIVQTGCVPDREIHGGLDASVITRTEPGTPPQHPKGHGISISIKDETEAESPGTPRRSLKNASALLGRAAEVVDTDELLAVQLIRHVIAILKYKVIPSLMEPNTSLVPIGSPSEAGEEAMAGGEAVTQIPNQAGDSAP